MSSKPEALSRKSAEMRFREAFERLKAGCTDVLPKGCPVSQNNVAKEAGLDRTALKKARFPSLVAEIQRWIDEHQEEAAPSERQKILAHRARNRSLRERIMVFKEERDHALSLLAEADAKILALVKELADAMRKIEKLEPKAKRLELPQ